MSTVAEIENAIKTLPFNDKIRLLTVLSNSIQLEQKNTMPPLEQKAPSNSVLDIPSVSVGRVLRPEFRREELLDEMLEGSVPFPRNASRDLPS